MNKTTPPTSGFTLIEMSIVLVVVGLIIGGVLVGQDMMKAAEIRATIGQLEKYNTAVNTFRLKYGYLPGDIPDPTASSFGFQARGMQKGQGDGDSFLLGWGGGGAAGNQQTAGEVVMFWVDLSTANLIDAGLNTATSTTTANITSSLIPLYFPPAKIGNGNYIYVYNGGYFGGPWMTDGFNYYGISAIISVNTSIYSNPGMTVQQSYSFDKKVDDGLPQSGNLTAVYINYALNTQTITWAAGGGNKGAHSGYAPSFSTTTATPYATTNCYDNNNVAGAVQTYSMQNASLLNCALSFKFQ